MITLFSIVVVSCTFSLLLPSHLSAKPHPWAELALSDLKIIRKTLKEHHPGPLDTQNPKFVHWLEKGYEAATHLARRIHTYEGYRLSLDRFINGFQDGHIQLWHALEFRKVSWPGFLVAKRGQSFVVHYAESEQPKKGWKLSSCEGKDPDKMVLSTVFPFQGIKALEAHWIKGTSHLFIDVANPLTSRPKTCVFNTGNRQVPVPLRWRPIAWKRIKPKVELAGFGRRPPQQYKESATRVWMTIPRFNPSQKAAKLLDQMIARLPTARSKKYVVFDVRGNGGGNSEWGRKIIRAFYGSKFALYRSRKQKTKEVYIEWRVSNENRAHVASFVPKLIEQFGEGAQITKTFTAVAEGMKNATRHRLYREPKTQLKSTTKPVGKVANLVKAKVFILTDGKCASACLDFMDELLRMPNVVHVGSSTSADTVYMDIRTISLPSKVAELSFPMKVYRNRQRKNNEAYVPQHAFEGDMWDTEKLEQWISSLAG